jgi:hypothetical protein
MVFCHALNLLRPDFSFPQFLLHVSFTGSFQQLVLEFPLPSLILHPICGVYIHEWCLLISHVEYYY